MLRKSCTNVQTLEPSLLNTLRFDVDECKCTDFADLKPSMHVYSKVWLQMKTDKNFDL